MLKAGQNVDRRPILRVRAAKCKPLREVKPRASVAAARVLTFTDQTAPSGASGLFFARAHRLFPVTSRHVAIEEALGPNRAWYADILLPLTEG